MAEEDEKQSLPEPATPQREHVLPDYHKNGSKLRKALIWLVVLVIIAAAGGGAVWYKKHQDNQRAARAAQAVQAAKPKVSDQITVGTKSYTSPNFYLTFNYPSDWTISDTGGGQMSVVSPAMQLKNAAGRTVTGQIEMLIRNSTNQLPEFSKGNAVAVFDSLKVSYKDPTQTQRAQTYLSFLQYASSTAGLDGIYITSDNGYTKGQAIPLVDVSKEDPIVSVAFSQCSDSNCSGKTNSLSISSDSWNDTGFSTPIKNMLESLSIT